MHYAAKLNCNQYLAPLHVRPRLPRLILIAIAAWISFIVLPGYAQEARTQKRDAYIQELHDALKLNANQEKSWQAIQVQAHKLLRQQQASRLQIHTLLDHESPSL